MNLLNKWKSMPEAAKSALAFTLSSFLIKGISFVTTPIFTRLLSPEQYGLTTTYHSWLTILEVFCLLGLTSAGVFNVGLNDYKDRRDQFISSVLTLCNTATVLFFGLVVIGKIIWGQDFLLPTSLLLLLFVHFLTNPAQIFWITRQRYEYRYKLATVITVCSSLLSQGCAILCVTYADALNAGTVRLWSTEAVMMLFAVPIYVLLMAKGKTFFDKTIWKQVLIFALPLLPHYLAQHVMIGADRIMLGEMVSQTDAGIYGVVSSISTIATIIWSAINASLVPYVFEKMNQKGYKDINRVTLLLIGTYAVMCCGVSLIAPEVLYILAPAEYYGGINAIPPIAGMSFLSALYNIYANVEFYHKKSGTIALATIVASITNVGLNWLLIPKYSYVGAAYTTLISYVVLIFVHYLGYRLCRTNRIYNNGIILGISLICIGFCEVCHLLYGMPWLRYGLIALMAIAVIVKRKSVMQLLDSMKK